MNRLFVLSFKDNDGWESQKKYLSTVEIRNYKVMIDGRNFFNQLIKNDLKTYDNIWEIARSRRWLHN